MTLLVSPLFPLLSPILFFWPTLILTDKLILTDALMLADKLMLTDTFAGCPPVAKFGTAISADNKIVLCPLRYVIFFAWF